jgi:acyl-CoA thioester hydrolase
MSKEFSVRIKVRGYEVDTQGHLNQAVYLQYAEHARWELLAAAGILQDELLATGYGPIVLETHVKYRRELRGGDEVDVGCAFSFDGGRLFRIRQVFRRPDRRIAADLTTTAGLLDLTARTLVDDPSAHFRTLAKDPAVLGLAAGLGTPVQLRHAGPGLGARPGLAAAHPPI